MSCGRLALAAVASLPQPTLTFIYHCRTVRSDLVIGRLIALASNGRRLVTWLGVVVASSVLYAAALPFTSPCVDIYCFLFIKGGGEGDMRTSAPIPAQRASREVTFARKLQDNNNRTPKLTRDS